MTALSIPDIAIGDRSESTVTQVAKANKHVFHCILAVQGAVFEEMVYASCVALDRARIEMQLFTEFPSKMAAAHSVRDIKTMCEECSRHQIDFIRRENERLFKHGERMIETTSNLIGGGRTE